MKSVKEYLPTPRAKDEMVPFCGRARRKLLNQVKTIAAKEGLTLTDVFEACLTHFVDEMSNSKRSA